MNSACDGLQMPAPDRSKDGGDVEFIIQVHVDQQLFQQGIVKNSGDLDWVMVGEASNEDNQEKALPDLIPANRIALPIQIPNFSDPKAGFFSIVSFIRDFK
jgi:hypothetical protein